MVAAQGHCTILACPGSGKTLVLSERAARLLTTHPKGRLCAVTFTRDAAEELKSRILASCGQDHARRLAVGTFHSLALARLKRAGLSKSPRLLSEGERMPQTDLTEEDERRLPYVGMMLAKHRLILSSAIEEGMASRFFEEAELV